MRVLVVHNRYSAATPSGENVSVDLEVDGLRAAGVDVHRHEVSNDDVLSGGVVDKLRAAAATTWSPAAAARLEADVARVRPDLVHVHNLFPLLTASVPSRALAQGLPVVWTARNLRVTCVEGTQFRAGADCTLCRPGWRVPGVRHRCYRGSLGASLLVTGATSIFRRLARTRTTTIAISQTLARWLVDSAGFDPQRVLVKYNAVATPDPAVPAPSTSDTFVFVGTFAAYKGVVLLLDAWRRIEAPEAPAALRRRRAAGGHDPSRHGRSPHQLDRSGPGGARSSARSSRPGPSSSPRCGTSRSVGSPPRPSRTGARW